MSNNKHLRSAYTHRAVKVLLVAGFFALAAFIYFSLYPYLNTVDNSGGSYFSLLVVIFALGSYVVLTYAIIHALNNTFIWNRFPERQTEAFVLRKLTQRQLKEVTKQDIAHELAGAATAPSLWKTYSLSKSVDKVSSGQGGIMFKTADNQSMVMLVPFNVFDSVSENESGILRFKEMMESKSLSLLKETPLPHLRKLFNTAVTMTKASGRKTGGF